MKNFIGLRFVMLYLVIIDGCQLQPIDTQECPTSFHCNLHNRVLNISVNEV